MAVYEIAGLRVQMAPRYPTLARQAQPYLAADQQGPVHFTLTADDAFLQAKQAENPHLTLNDCEYIWVGAAFYRALLHYEGFLLHASAVMMDGKAYLFTAPSGTGKSTHTALWQRCFGPDRARILNDDKPALRLRDGVFVACGTPFSGKTDLNINCTVPLQGICLLSRAAENRITRLTGRQALAGILNQTLRPTEAEEMDRLLRLMDRLLRTVPVYALQCNMEKVAAELSYQTMKSYQEGTVL